MRLIKVSLLSLTFLIIYSMQDSYSQNSNNESGETEWVLSEILRSGRQGMRILGNPKIVKSEFGDAVRFDGKEDAIFLDETPLFGLEQFTIEMLFRPDVKGNFEQRFFHSGEISGDRLLIELRATSKDWYLDSFIKCGEEGETLIEPKLLHPLGKWYHIAFVVNKGKLSSYVNGVNELNGQMNMTPLGMGQTSIGVRQNEISWFKGAIYKVRINPVAIEPESFMKF